MIPGLLLAYSGMSVLCFAMRRQQTAPEGSPISAFHGVALCLLIVSLAVCVADAHGAGMVAWFGWLSVSGVALAFLLPYIPRVMGGLALLAMGLAAWLLAMR